MRAIFLLIILILATRYSFAADCPSSVKRIETGTPSPCDGWIVSSPKMQELAKMTDELDLSKKLILAQDHLQKLTEEEVEHYKKRSKEGEKALSQSEKQKFFLAAGAFALGVIGTGIAAKAAIESTR